MIWLYSSRKTNTKTTCYQYLNIETINSPVKVCHSVLVANIFDIWKETKRKMIWFGFIHFYHNHKITKTKTTWYQYFNIKTTCPTEKVCHSVLVAYIFDSWKETKRKNDLIWLYSFLSLNTQWQKPKPLAINTWILRRPALTGMTKTNTTGYHYLDVETTSSVRKVYNSVLVANIFDIWKETTRKMIWFDFIHFYH